MTAVDDLVRVTDELLARLDDLEDCRVAVSVAPYVQLTETIGGPCYVISVSMPSPVLGQRLGHIEFVNPFDQIDDDLLTKVAFSVRSSLALRRQRALGSIQ